jgi:hypothetical protein
LERDSFIRPVVLIWELVDCVKWIKQGRVELAKNYLRKLGGKL